MALALEVIWTRMLLLVFGSTTYAFTIMLATFLCGIALGAVLARRWVDKQQALTEWLAMLFLSNGLVIVALVWAVDRLPALYLKTLAYLGISWANDMIAKTLVSATFMGLPTLLFGAIFPVVARLAVSRTESLGRGIGTVYATNTAGAILGSVVGGFVLLPLLGMQKSILVLGGLLSVIGATVFAIAAHWSTRRRAVCAMVFLGVTCVLIAAGKPWDRARLASGVYIAPHAYIAEGRRVTLARELAAVRVLYFKEGKTATVSVLLEDGLRKSLRVDGKVEMSTITTDRRLGRLMGHLPMLVHPEPRAVLNIGLGGGLTVAALAAHGPPRIDVAEIEPVVEGAARLFAAENKGVMDDPRVHLIFNDGRNHLLLTDKYYDVITSDPFEP